MSYQNINQYNFKRWYLKPLNEISDISLASDEKSYDEEVIFSPYLIGEFDGEVMPLKFNFSSSTTIDVNNFGNFDSDTIVSENYWNPKNEDLLTCGIKKELCNVGLTGIDNGLVKKFSGETIEINTGLYSGTTDKFSRYKYDRRFKMHPITGFTTPSDRLYNDDSYTYKLSIKNDNNIIGNYINFSGGFYQGFYKLAGYNYEVLPQRYNLGWTGEFLLRYRWTGDTNTGLNKRYPDNKGMFFFYGARAENKFYHYADGSPVSDTGYTRVTEGLTCLKTCECEHSAHTKATCHQVYQQSGGTTTNCSCGQCPCDCTVAYEFPELDPLYDGVSNAMALRLSGDTGSPRLCVKVYKITGGCETTGTCVTGITYTTGTSVTEWCSTRGIFDDCSGTTYYNEERWVQIDAVFERDTYLDDCDLQYKGGLKEIVQEEYVDTLLNNSVALIEPPLTKEPIYDPEKTEVVNITERWIGEKNYRLGNFKFYVNGKLFLVIQGFEEIIPRPLNTWKENQIGVAYNISLGGGTQGLHDNLTVTGCATSISGMTYQQDPECLTTETLDETIYSGLTTEIKLEEYFGGSFNGDISAFRMYTEPLNAGQIIHNFKILKEKYALLDPFCLNCVNPPIPAPVTPTPTPTITVTMTQTLGLTPTPSTTPAPSCDIQYTLVPTPTNTSTPTTTPTPTISETPTTTPTPTETNTPTPTETPSQTPGLSPTPTESVTPTISETPTITPTITPTTTPPPFTGYSFNLVDLPYAPPTQGNIIFTDFDNGGTSGITSPNTFELNGVYWDFTDNLGINRYSFYSGLTLGDFLISFSYGGSSAIYSGNSTTFTLDTTNQDIFYNPFFTPNNITLITPSLIDFVIGMPVSINFTGLTEPIPTPSVTQTQTPTPTTTETPTLTPSVTTTTTETPTPSELSRFVFNVVYGPSYGVACPSTISTTIYGTNSTWSSNTQFYNNASGPVTIDMANFYNYLGEVIELDSSGQFISGVLLCPTPTPTETTTETPTPTQTDTPTQTPSVTTTTTPTPSSTQSIGIVTSGLQLYLNAGDNNSYPGTGTTWTDLSPNSYLTTLIGGVGFSSVSAETLTFNGVNQYVDTNQSLSSESFTVGAWFRTTAGGIKMILSKEENAGNPWNYRVWMSGGQITGDMSQSPANQAQLSSILTNYNNGNWYQVMFTRDDSNWYLYVNGVQVNTRVDPYVGSVTNSQEVWIGQSAYLGGSYDYTGDISEVMIYNRVLSSAEILQNYNATKTRFGL